MNFLAHAVVAAAERSSPRFALGAILPDLASMLGDRLHSRDVDVIDGVAHHHRADASFHESGTFVDLVARGRAALRQAGVTRGPMLAAPHVAVELTLDGVLATRPPAIEGLRAALAEVRTAEVETSNAVRTDQFHRLVDHLADNDLRRWYGSPAAVVERIERMLGRRPRLALRGGDRAAIERWLTAESPVIEEAVPALLAGASGRATLSA